MSISTLTQSTKFCQLPVSLLAQAIQYKLSGSDWNIWVYLLALDPFGDRPIEIHPAAIAQELGISLPQVRRSIKKLCSLGLYLIEVSMKGVNRFGSKYKPKEVIKNDHEVIKNDHEVIKNDHEVIKNDHIEKLEPIQDIVSKTSHTIHTYSYFLQTLPENKRCSFEKFCEYKINANPNIKHRDRWLDKVYLSLWDEFCKKDQIKKELSPTEIKADG